MPHSRRLPWLLVILLLTAAPVRADERSETTNSAIMLLRTSMQVHRNGQHNVLLRALRQMHDPELEPLFSELAQRDVPELKLHGLLGLAECSPERKIDLVRFAALENIGAQAQLIGAALDADLVNDEQARQIMNWDQIDPAVKLVLAAPLVKNKNLPSVEPLRASAKDENIAKRGVALVMLQQLSEPGALDGLREIARSADNKRDRTLEMMLQTAYQYEFDRVGPWALEVATQPGVTSHLGIAALRTAMRFGAPGATDVWKQQFESSPDPSVRTRLALEALRLSPWMEPGLYAPLIKSEDPVIKQIGVAGEAIASKQRIAESMVELIKQGNAFANGWAIAYARKFAAEADAKVILMELIHAAETGEGWKAQRLADAVAAVEMLMEVAPKEGPQLIRPILANEKTDPKVAQAILLGLLGSNGTSHEAAEGLTFRDPLTSNLAVVLLAKTGRALNNEQLRDLSLVVRGGGVKQEPVRIQAAWIYLKMTGQSREALAQVLGKS
jgi:hypothetical protein